MTLSDETRKWLDAIWPGPGGEAPNAYAWLDAEINGLTERSGVDWIPSQRSHAAIDHF